MVVRRKGSENDKQSLSTQGRRKRNSHISERFGRHCQQGFPVRLWLRIVVKGASRNYTVVDENLLDEDEESLVALRYLHVTLIIKSSPNIFL